TAGVHGPAGHVESADRVAEAVQIQEGPRQLHFHVVSDLVVAEQAHLDLAQRGNIQISGNGDARPCGVALVDLQHAAIDFGQTRVGVVAGPAEGQRMSCLYNAAAAAQHAAELQTAGRHVNRALVVQLDGTGDAVRVGTARAGDASGAE